MSAITAAHLLSRPKLKHFKRSEFGVWFNFISTDTLLAVDKFAGLWKAYKGYNAPVTISGADGGIVRLNSGTSQHDIFSHGLLSNALDFFPSGMDAKADMSEAVKLAAKSGFTGIGVYTDTKPSNMMHGDTRKNKARWSRNKNFAGQYGRDGGGYGSINLAVV